MCWTQCFETKRYDLNVQMQEIAQRRGFQPGKAFQSNRSINTNDFDMKKARALAHIDFRVSV